jgi:hypothetical protein
MLSFLQWLENAGEVNLTNLSNVAADDAFKQLRSKYMAGNVPQRGKTFDPDKKFGKRHLNTGTQGEK